MMRSENVKPIFLKDEDVFGSCKPERSLWLANVEIYKAIGDKVQVQCIKGIQREIFRTIHHFMPTFMTLSTHPIIRTVIYKVSWS
jgi:hypothetical protein